MPPDYTQDLIAIREWMSKEPHLPQDFDDDVLQKFLNSCKGSLEKTKKCLDSFCSSRTQLTDVYTSRDPLSSNLQTAFSVTVVTIYEFEENEILIHKYDDPTMENYSFYDLLKTLSIHLDHVIKYRSSLPEGYYFVADMSCYSLKMIPKVNPTVLRDFLVYLLQSMPLFVKKIYVVNAPSFYDKLFALLKPALPSERSDFIHFFSDYESLHQFIDKKYLPSEYDGEAQSMYERNNQWQKNIEKDRELFLNDNLWKADLKKKSKNYSTDNTMEGSFRSLTID